MHDNTCKGINTKVTQVSELYKGFKEPSERGCSKPLLIVDYNRKENLSKEIEDIKS